MVPKCDARQGACEDLVAGVGGKMMVTTSCCSLERRKAGKRVLETPSNVLGVQHSECLLARSDT